MRKVDEVRAINRDQKAYRTYTGHDKEVGFYTEGVGIWQWILNTVMKLMDIFWKNLSGYYVEKWLHGSSIKQEDSLWEMMAAMEVVRSGKIVYPFQWHSKGFTEGQDVYSKREKQERWLQG